jgi:ABC-type polysaccharide/polyol phosphate transport system ATPase subunit
MKNTMPTSSDNIAIKVNKLSKCYSIKNAEKGKGVIHALDDVSFEINKGEVIGIIGPNGSGKSTLLKIISEIMAPTSGSVEIKGKVASILEVGTGFNPDLSGRKNIYLNARLHGMKKAEVDTKFNDIVELFGFRNFLDTPVKQYSSGMYMRLAFAVVVNIDADIYLFDEVLSVGDGEFRGKVIEKLEELKKFDKTVMFVSHNMNEFINICDKMLAIEKGKCISYGSPGSVVVRDHLTELAVNENNISEYYENLGKKKQILDAQLIDKVEPVSCKLKFNDNGKMQIIFEYSIEKDIDNVKNYLLIKDRTTRPIVQLSFKTLINKEKNKVVESIEININAFGQYLFIFDVICLVNDKPAFVLPQILQHKFESKNIQIGLINIDEF